MSVCLKGLLASQRPSKTKLGVVAVIAVVVVVVVVVVINDLLDQDNLDWQTAQHPLSCCTTCCDF